MEATNLIKPDMLTKSVVGQIALRGINAKQFTLEKPKGKKCITCGSFSPPQSTNYQNTVCWVEPVECNSCRTKSYEEYLINQRKQKYRDKSTKCGGYMNVPVYDKEILVTYESLFESGHQEKPLKHIMGILEEKHDKGAFFYGDVGTGKTFLLKVLCNELAKQYRNYCFVKSVELVDLLRSACDRNSSFTPHKLVEDFQRASILVIDDLGAEKSSDFVVEKYFQIFDYRIEHKKTTFFTSNKTLEELKEFGDRRLASRLGDRNWLSYYNFGNKDIRMFN